MDTTLYGKIQGFLLALETLNNDSAPQGGGCYFRFVHVPPNGSLKQSLFVANREEREASKMPVLAVQPVLEPSDDWHTLRTILENRLFWITLPSPTAQEVHAGQLMGLMTAFFGSDARKTWRLRWRYPHGSDVFTAASPAEWVFERSDTSEWFHLTLDYGG